jgi:hypothetical protein
VHNHFLNTFFSSALLYLDIHTILYIKIRINSNLMKMTKKSDYRNHIRFSPSHYFLLKFFFFSIFEFFGGKCRASHLKIQVGGRVCLSHHYLTSRYLKLTCFYFLDSIPPQMPICLFSLFIRFSILVRVKVKRI